MKESWQKIKKFGLGESVPTLRFSEVLYSAVGAGLGMVVAAWISRYYIGDAGIFLVASMGAASVLFYAVPHSPLAQPWPFFGGHVISAAAGVTSAYLFNDTVLAVAVAITLAIFAMQVLRCLHPPGGAVALLAVLGGDSVRDLGYQFVLAPVALNAAVVLGMALIVVNLTPGRRYPLCFATPSRKQQEDLEITPPAFNEEDLNAALAQMNTFIDVSQGDLNKIYSLAALESQKRRLGLVYCRDIMSHPVVTAEFGTELAEAWNLMHDNGIKSLPVIDPARRVIGIVTVADFLKEAHSFREEGLIQERLRQLIRRTTTLTSDKAEVVGQIMTRHVVTVTEETHIISLLPIFAEKGIHHLPVVNEERRIVGMVTRYDVMQALHEKGATD